MVKISPEENEDRAPEVKEIKAGQAKGGSVLSADLSGDRLPEPNVELVRDARVRLRQEYELLEKDEAAKLYSRHHYDALMNPESAFTCWRYLLHCDKDVETAVELMKAAMAWRKAYNIDIIRSRDLIKDFWLRAPIGFTGKTREGDDIVYAVGKNYRKPSSMIKQTVRDFISFILFDWDRKHEHDLDQLVLVFDITDTGLRNIDLDFSAWLVSIRDYVPARIKAIYFVGIPFIIRPIIRLIISWLPERYKRIAHCGTWDELVVANIDEKSLPAEVGGLADNKWRLAPVEARWAHEVDDMDSNEIFAKICEACSFNTTDEQLDRLYKMQIDHEKLHKSSLASDKVDSFNDKMKNPSNLSNTIG